MPDAGINSPEAEEVAAVKKLGHTCIECGSSSVNTTVEREGRMFSFERIDFACGATLETVHTANGNISRAIQSGCTESP